MDLSLGQLREGLSFLLEPFRDIWGLYQGFDPEQQRAVLFVLPVLVLGLIGWGMYQSHGDRVVIVLPAMLLRYSLVLLVLPVVAVGTVAGRGTSVPEFLKRDWTAEPDPDRPEIPMKQVNPMKLPGNLENRR
ncbi:MAG: hypothetical protein L0G70_02780 [Rubrobacter sp.]|nr:hypothetical protein [Rubrobacter sp.]